MRKPVVLVVSMFSAAASAFGAAGAKDCPATAEGPDAEEIRSLEERGARANVEGWSIEEARAFFAPEWASVQPNGEVSDVDAVLSAFKDDRSVPWAGRFDLSDLDIRVYCDTAVVIGRGEAWAPGAPAEVPPAVKFRFLNVWRKEGGRWLYAANQFVRY